MNLYVRRSESGDYLEEGRGTRGLCSLVILVAELSAGYQWVLCLFVEIHEAGHLYVLLYVFHTSIKSVFLSNHF